MNKRIKELMGKTLDSEFSHTWDTMTHEGLLQFSEKFAELIVRECMVCSAWVGRVNKTAIEPAHTAHAINQRIKQQFGIEE